MHQGFPGVGRGADQMVKNLPIMQETRLRSLGQEDPLGKGMATHSSMLAWRIQWTEEPSGSSGSQPTVSQRVGHNWAAKLSTANASSTINSLLTNGNKCMNSEHILYNEIIIFLKTDIVKCIPYWHLKDFNISFHRCKRSRTSYEKKKSHLSGIHSFWVLQL